VQDGRDAAGAHLCVSAGITRLGSSITEIALPFVLIDSLAASDAFVVRVHAAEQLLMVLVSLPVGALLASLPVRRAAIATELASMAVLLLLVPLWLAGDLSAWHLAAAMLSLRVLAIVASIAIESLVPLVVGRTELRDVNRRLGTVVATSDVAGPGAAGIVFGTIGFVGGLVVDAASYALSAFALARVDPGDTAPAPAPASEQGVGKAGSSRDPARRPSRMLALLWRNPGLLRMSLTAGLSNVFAVVAGGVEILFLVKVLDAPAWLIGVLFGLTGLGGILGGFALRWLDRAFRPADVVLLAQLVVSIPVLALPFAQPGWMTSFYVIGWFSYAASSVMFQASATSFLHLTTEADQVPLLAGTRRWVSYSGALVGAILLVVLQEVLDIRTLVAVSSVGIYLSFIPLVIGRHWRDTSGVQNEGTPGRRSPSGRRPS
jgi:Na+/melibiose symporter-like transporter